jgi:hypothetical protein
LWRAFVAFDIKQNCPKGLRIALSTNTLSINIFIFEREARYEKEYLELYEGSGAVARVCGCSINTGLRRAG